MSVDVLAMAQLKLDQLRTERTRLSTALAACAQRLETVGSPPSDDLISGLHDYRLSINELSSQVSSAIKSCGLAPINTTDATWQSLHETVQTVHGQLEARRLLSLIDRLRHRDDHHFVPLAECHRISASLWKNLEDPELAPDVLVQLNSEKHPFRALVRLVTEGETLSDELWTELNDQVIECYGRALATAVARSKIEMETELPIVTPVQHAVSNSEQALPTKPATAERITDGNSETTIQTTPSHTRDESEHDTHLMFEETKTQDLLGNSPLPELDAPQIEAVTNTADMHVKDIIAADATLIEVPPSPNFRQPLTPVHSASIFETPTGLLRQPEPPRGQLLSPTESLHASTAKSDIQAYSDNDSILDQSQTESIFDTFDLPRAPNNERSSSPIPRILTTRGLQRNLVSSDSLAEPLMDRQSLNNETALLARNTRQTDGDARHSQLSQLVLLLLRNERLTLAYHLTRGMETRLRGCETVLPSRLLHALVLGRHICYAKGEIARKVEEDLKDFSPQFLSAGDSQWNEATGLFVRAAALIPALLASSPTASAMLRSFRITPGLSQLYNYCSRLSTYGHRLQGQAPDLFTPDCDLANWENETTALSKSIEDWLAQTVKSTCETSRSSLLFLHAHWTLTNGSVSRFAESSRLWSKWQECFRLVHRLLKPALYGHEQERNWVKSEIDRISQCVRLEAKGTEFGQTLPPGTITFPLEAMLTTIREGVDFASRWLRLCASKPAQGRTLASREAESLRDEILERSDAVIAELEIFGQQHPAPRTQAAVSCLRGTIEHLRQIFSPHSTLALREADPRHVLYGEFLKIPNLKMNDQWIPTADHLTIENEILSYLCGEELDWKQAFEMQCSHRDHVATERILQMNVWRTEQQREGLKRRRSNEIQSCQEELFQELAELREWISDPTRYTHLSPALQLEVESSLQRLETMIESNVDYASMHDEINQLRLTLERRKRDRLNQLRRTETSGIWPKSATPFHRSEHSEESAPSAQESWSRNILSDS